MFIWIYSEDVPTQATAEQIWEMWKDAATWPCWDSELEWVKLDGNFVTGTRGSMKPASGPVVKFLLNKVVVNRSFSNIARLPLTHLAFEHEYFPPQNDGVPAQIRHSVTMSGLLAPLFGRIIGSKIKIHLRQAMLELSERALTGNKTAK